VKIEICGPDCAGCHVTMENVQKVVKELRLEQEVKVTEVKDIKAINTKGGIANPRRCH